MEAARLDLNFGDGDLAHVAVYTPNSVGLPYLVVFIGVDGKPQLLGHSLTLDEANSLMRAVFASMSERKLR